MAIADISADFQHFQSKIREMVDLSLKRPETMSDSKLEEVGKVYRAHVVGHAWGKTELPLSLSHIFREMIKLENIVAHRNPLSRYKRIVGEDESSSKIIMETIPICFSVLQMCLSHWERPKYNKEIAKRLESSS